MGRVAGPRTVSRDADALEQPVQCGGPGTLQGTPKLLPPAPPFRVWIEKPLAVQRRQHRALDAVRIALPARVFGPVDLDRWVRVHRDMRKARQHEVHRHKDAAAG